MTETQVEERIKSLNNEITILKNILNVQNKPLEVPEPSPSLLNIKSKILELRENKL